MEPVKSPSPFVIPEPEYQKRICPVCSIAFIVPTRREPETKEDAVWDFRLSRASPACTEAR